MRGLRASSIHQQSSPACGGRPQDSPAPFDCAQGRLRETGVPGSPLLGELGRRSAGYALMALLASLRHARMPGLRASSIHSNRVPQKRDGDRIAQHPSTALRAGSAKLGSRFAALGRTGEAECWVDSILKFEPLQGRHVGMSRRTRLRCSSRHPLSHFSKNISRLVSAVISGHT